jgi:hypothetical protein
MKYSFGVLLSIHWLLLGCATGNGKSLNEVALSFTTREVQEAIDKAPKSKSLMDGLVVVSLEGGPVVTLGEPKGRIGIAARLAVQVAGAAPVVANIKGSANLVYIESQKAFFLDDPILNSIDAPYLPKFFEGVVIDLAKEQVVKVVNTTPIFVLPEDGLLAQRVARRLLKSVQIQPDQVVAIFALQ